MNTVTTINLAGTAFQIEDPGYVALKKYLDDAKAALEGNPDRDEIVADMERAIADKCRAYVSAHKDVISADEAAKIVAEMGPVNAGSEGASDAGAQPRKPKRLYRIQEGEILGGVATGFAAYFDVDVMLIRILFVLLLILTGGGFVFGYVLAWIFIPPAETPLQRAQAYGAPFNAQEIVDRVKTEYARLEAKMPAWKTELEKAHDAHKEWKRERKQWRKQQRAWQESFRQRDAWRGPSAIGELLQILVVVFLLWLAYHHVAIAREFMDAVWNFFQNVVNTLTQAIVNASR